jgi:nitrous oxidase accessory protein NosD
MHWAWLAVIAVLLHGGAQAAEVRRIGSLEALRDAVADARPGQVLELVPGTYRIAGRTLEIRRPGTQAAPITLRAEHLGEVILKVESVEGVLVAAPYWRFENLVMEGVCADDGDCEHAFHVVGAATDVLIRNNRLLDFNSAIKVNGNDSAFPDRGVIEGNSLIGRRARRTGNPVTGVDIVAASGWMVRGNLIADLVKDGGNRISYGAFMKGGGEGGLFENNVVACGRSVAARAPDEARIGLSFGGGGTEDRYCRDGACRYEHRGGVMRNNVILNCSDVGIYLNRALDTRILRGTLYQTGGIDVRFPASSAVVRNTVLDGRIRERDGGKVAAADNRTMAAADWLRFQVPDGFCGRSLAAVETCDPHDLAKR